MNYIVFLCHFPVKKVKIFSIKKRLPLLCYLQISAISAISSLLHYLNVSTINAFLALSFSLFYKHETFSM